MDMLKNGWGNLNRFFGLLDPEFDEQHFEYETVGSSRQVRACGAGQFSQFNSTSWQRSFNRPSSRSRSRSRSSAVVHQSLSNISQSSSTFQPQRQQGRRQLQFLCVIDVPQHEASKGEILPPKVFNLCLSFLYTRDYQNCRLVCRLWKSRVAPFLKEKSCIVIDGRHVGSLLSDGCAEKCLKYLKHSVSKFSSWTTLRLRFMKESQMKLLLKSADFQIAAKSILELELWYCEFSWVSLLKILKHFINLQCFVDNRSVYKSTEPSSAFERFSGSNLFTTSTSSSSSNSNSNSNGNGQTSSNSANNVKSRITLYKEALGLKKSSSSSDDSTSTHGRDPDRLESALLQAAVGHEDLKCLKILKENCNKNTTDLLKLLTILTMDIEEFHLKVNPQESSVSIQETYEFERHLSIFLFMNAGSFTHLSFNMMDTVDIGYFNDFLKLFQDWISPPFGIDKELTLRSLTLKFKYVWLSKSFEMILIPLIRKCRMLEQLGIGLIAFKPESAYVLNMLQDSLPSDCEMEFALYLSDHDGTKKVNVNPTEPEPEVEGKENEKPKELDSKSNSKLKLPSNSELNSQSSTTLIKKRKRFFSFQDEKWYRQQKMTDLLIGIFHDQVESVRELLSDEKPGKSEKPGKLKDKENDDKNKSLNSRLKNGPQLSNSFLATKQYNNTTQENEDNNTNKFSKNFQHVVDLHIFTNESRRNFKSFDIPFLTELFKNLTKFELVDGPLESYWGKNVQYHNNVENNIQNENENNKNKTTTKNKNVIKNSTSTTTTTTKTTTTTTSANNSSTVKRSKSTIGFKRHSHAKITDGDLQCIIANLKRLKTLMIFANMETVTDSGLTGLTPEVCKRMIKTKDYNVRSRNEFQGVSLSTLKHLQYLSLRGIGPNLTDVCVHWGFSKMRHLRTLIISRYTWLSVDGRQLLDMMYPESKCFLGAL